MRRILLCALAVSVLSVGALQAQTISDTLVTTTTEQTITGAKTFNPTPAPSSSYASGTLFTSNFNLTANSGILSTVRFNAPAITNSGNYTYGSYAVLVKGPMLVEDFSAINEVRTNQIRWKTASTINILKPTENTGTLMAIKPISMIKVTSAINNGLLLQDSVTFNSNTVAAGFNALQVNPLLTQTGYTGTTRGIYVAPVLTGVTDFRAIQTNVSSGNGYQIFAEGDAPSIFNGDLQTNKALRSNSVTRLSDINSMSFTTPNSNGVPYPLVFQLSQYGTLSRMGVGNKAVVSFRYPFFTTSGVADYATLKITDTVSQTGTSTGVVRGLFIEPVILATTGYRGLETNIDANANTFQLYAKGTAPSYFGGNVGIGTSVTGDYKLAVEGIIGARRIKVLSGAWADYVFDSAYQLRPLAKVEQYIQQNKHLPDVPTAAAVAKDGVDVGDTQVMLLKKIEELTLYIIEQNKKQEALTKQVEQQSVQIQLLLQKMK